MYIFNIFKNIIQISYKQQSTYFIRKKNNFKILKSQHYFTFHFTSFLNFPKYKM